MFKSLSYERKFQALIVFTCLFAFVIYQATISKTIGLYSKDRELSLLLNNVSSAPKQIEELQKRMAYFERLVQQNSANSHEGNHDVLLNAVSRYCKENNVLLKSFPEQVVAKQEGFEVQTSIFTAQGNFLALVKLLYLLEQKEKTGKLSSAKFFLSKAAIGQKQELLVTVYQQNLKKTQ